MRRSADDDGAAYVEARRLAEQIAELMTQIEGLGVGKVSPRPGEIIFPDGCIGYDGSRWTVMTD
ncbi:hypothetical protein AB0C52_35830 [Streptomyces sp. NPDC048717]|uniref:hypothetical protein n=1 Tax=Streptomyces sp. NPDC048717 TaxID=3154928 RepID=UPI00341457E3